MRARILAFGERLIRVRDKISSWNLLCEDEDRACAEEMQTILILTQMLTHEPCLFTPAGLDYVDEMIARSEEWINEKLEDQNG